MLPYKLLGRPRLHHNLLSAEGMWEEGSQEWVSAVLAVMQDRAPAHSHGFNRIQC